MVEGSEPLFVNIRHVQLNDANGKELFTATPYDAVFLISESGVIWVSASHSIFKISPLESGSEKIIKDHSFFNNMRENMNDVERDIIKIIEDTTNGQMCFKGKNFLITLNEKGSKASYWNCVPLDISLGRNQVVCDKGILYERSAYGLICFDLLKKKIYRLRSYNTEYDKIMSTPFSLYKEDGWF